MWALRSESVSSCLCDSYPWSHLTNPRTVLKKKTPFIPLGWTYLCQSSQCLINSVCTAVDWGPSQQVWLGKRGDERQKVALLPPQNMTHLDLSSCCWGMANTKVRQFLQAKILAIASLTRVSNFGKIHRWVPQTPIWFLAAFQEDTVRERHGRCNLPPY